MSKLAVNGERETDITAFSVYVSQKKMPLKFEHKS